MTFLSGKRRRRRRKLVITLRRAGFFLPTERPGKASLYPLLYRVAALVRRKGQQGEDDSRRHDGERASNRKNRQIKQHAVLLLNAQTLVHERQTAARQGARVLRYDEHRQPRPRGEYSCRQPEPMPTICSP